MAKSTNVKRREQRIRLFQQQQGLCYYCQCEMILPQPGNDRQDMLPNLCTIEHLDDRFSPERGSFQNEIRHVVACYKCNNERSTRRMLEHIEEQRKRSQHKRKRAVEIVEVE